MLVKHKSKIERLKKLLARKVPRGGYLKGNNYSFDESHLNYVITNCDDDGITRVAMLAFNAAYKRLLYMKDI